MFSKRWFLELEQRLRDAGLDSDSKTFDEIKADLQNPKTLSPIEFAIATIYVILAGGFAQKTAKKKHAEIIDCLQNNNGDINQSDLLKIFNNKNKTAAILKVWQNKNNFRNEYYKLADAESKISYLYKLPHIGKITSNHLARNLGEDVVKYDIWIQRLGVLYSGDKDMAAKINNAKLNPDIKKACDRMFLHLEKETGLPRGYLDVVLWKACQNKLISMDS